VILRVMNEEQMLEAVNVGARRHIYAMKANSLDKATGCTAYGLNKWEHNIEGAAGESVVADFLGIEWRAPHNGIILDGKCDLISKTGKKVEVRTRLITPLRGHNELEMGVSKDCDDDSVYIFVTGRMPEFYIHGWLYGRECKRPEWLKALKEGFLEQYFVPSGELRRFKKE
jgi:hypothetical protein